MKLEMVNEFIGCKPEKRREEKTAGGIILPPSKQDENTEIYIITSVPAGCKDFKEGELIAVDRHTVTRTVIRDEELYYILPTNIIAKVHD